MSGLYWLGLIVAVLLFVYLVVALFKPEAFD
jgi:K+-transporting ATPase KdpF subunit